PNPQPPAGTSTTDGTQLIDDGMRWLVDFNRAVEVGMGISVRVSTDLVIGGMARLVVLGVKASVDPQDHAQRLGALLDAQHFTRGLACVPPGTPTNNTPEVSAGYGATDPGHRQSFVDERNGPLFIKGNGANG